MSRFPFWFKIIGQFHRTRTLRTLASSLLVVGLYTGLMAWLEIEVLDVDFKPTPTIYQLLGLVLGLLLVFRTNTAYERWWEGRRLLGQLTNASRNLALKLHAFLPAGDTATREFFARHVREILTPVTLANQPVRATKELALNQ